MSYPEVIEKKPARKPPNQTAFMKLTDSISHATLWGSTDGFGCKRSFIFRLTQAETVPNHKKLWIHTPLHLVTRGCVYM